MQNIIDFLNKLQNLASLETPSKEYIAELSAEVEKLSSLNDELNKYSIAPYFDSPEKLLKKQEFQAAYSQFETACNAFCEKYGVIAGGNDQTTSLLEILKHLNDYKFNQTFQSAFTKYLLGNVFLNELGDISYLKDYHFTHFKPEIQFHDANDNLKIDVNSPLILNTSYDDDIKSRDRYSTTYSNKNEKSDWISSRLNYEIVKWNISKVEDKIPQLTNKIEQQIKTAVLNSVKNYNENIVPILKSDPNFIQTLEKLAQQEVSQKYGEYSEVTEKLSRLVYSAESIQKTTFNAYYQDTASKVLSKYFSSQNNDLKIVKVELKSRPNDLLFEIQNNIKSISVSPYNDSKNVAFKVTLGGKQGYMKIFTNMDYNVWDFDAEDNYKAKLIEAKFGDAVVTQIAQLNKAPDKQKLFGFK